MGTGGDLDKLFCGVVNMGSFDETIDFGENINEKLKKNFLSSTKS